MSYFKGSLITLFFSGSNKVTFTRLKTVIDKSKQQTQKLAIDHRELHSTVSKVGKAIDRVCNDLI